MPTPTTGRMKRLYLTDKARPILAQMKTLADEVRAEMLAGIEPEEREQLRRLLGRMKDNMTDDDKVGPARAARGTSVKGNG